MSEKSIVVVGIDDTEGARRALAWAAGEALRRDAALKVLTTWVWDPVDTIPMTVPDRDLARSAAEQLQHRLIDSVLGHWTERPELICEVRQAPAAEALVEASQQAELVVVGTHGRGPVRSLLLGSVSLSVMTHSACPVVVIPPPRQAEAQPEPTGTAVG